MALGVVGVVGVAGLLLRRRRRRGKESQTEGLVPGEEGEGEGEGKVAGGDGGVYEMPERRSGEVGAGGVYESH